MVGLSVQHTPRPEPSAAFPAVLAEELEFYGSYEWVLKRHLSVGEAIDRVGEEAHKLLAARSEWQTTEIATNIFLLSCGLLNCLDEYIRGSVLRLPGRLAQFAPARAVANVADIVSDRPLSRDRKRLLKWRAIFVHMIDEFLLQLVASMPLDQAALADAAEQLAKTLRAPLLRNLYGRHIGIPSPFSRLDLTLEDVIALGEQLAMRHPECSQPILLLGLRTSGSYFAPVLKALLRAKGYRSVAVLTIEPNKGPGRRERSELARLIKRDYAVVIVDDPPYSGGTVMAALDIARRAGCATNKLTVLAPTHPASRGWHSDIPVQVISLQPEHWHRHALLRPATAERRLSAYFQAHGYVGVRVVESKRAEAFNHGLQDAAGDPRSSRLKRVFELELSKPDGQTQTRYVLAKSVGCGWLGYHGFLAGIRLAGFVPQILGLREGILYLEWIPQDAGRPTSATDRQTHIDAAAAYVAARARQLSLMSDWTANVDLGRLSNGSRLVEKALSRAYGGFPIDALMRRRLGRRAQQMPCPCPTFIDGNMQCPEWIEGAHGPMKTDFEHHGMGKGAMNMIDPAYDLADAIFNLGLSAEEEDTLLRRYTIESGDVGVRQRLFINKLIAGICAMDRAQEQLLGAAPGGEVQQQRHHQRFIDAWHFLIAQTARRCGSYCQPAADLRWQAPLVFMDIDGVLDRRLFGFPTTTAAGIDALSLLNARGFSVALNTARSVAEVKAYCSAYSLSGGVAEYGSYIWDAVHQRGRVLIDDISAHQLEVLRRALRSVPGVFLDNRHQYSIRAFTYKKRSDGLLAALRAAGPSGIGDGVLAPLSHLVVQQLIADHGLDRLKFRQTTIDTTITAQAFDKGTGLTALRDWVIGPDAETIAIGDHLADLPMFRAATRSFAPVNIRSISQAKLVGCKIARHAYQRGLFDIACALVGIDPRRTERASDHAPPYECDLFLDALKAADQGVLRRLIRAVADPAAFGIFMR